MRCQADVRFVAHAHTHTQPHTWRACIISSEVALCLDAAVRTRVVRSAFRAVVIGSIEKAGGASLAFCSLGGRGGDELFARSALDCQSREQFVCVCAHL